MPARVYQVDFTNKVLLEEQCIPKVSRLRCDCCSVTYKHIEDSLDNMQFVEFSKEVVMSSGKNKANITVRVCKSCCLQLGEMFKEGI